MVTVVARFTLAQRPQVQREEVADMTGSKKRRDGEARRETARTDQISLIVRVLTMIWEIVWTMVHEGTGPGRHL